MLYQARHRYILSQKELLRELEVVCTTKAGAEIWVEFSCSAIQTELKGLYDFVYIGRDITERKQKDMEIRRSLAKEQELRQLKSRFFLMLAHEFGNPLSTVLLATQMLKDYGDEITNEEKQGIRSINRGKSLTDEPQTSQNRSQHGSLPRFIERIQNKNTSNTLNQHPNTWLSY